MKKQHFQVIMVRECCRSKTNFLFSSGSVDNHPVKTEYLVQCAVQDFLKNCRSPPMQIPMGYMLNES